MAKVADLVVDCSGDREITRQEFKDQCDTSYLLSRLGAGQAYPPMGPVGVVDYDLDLLSARNLVEEARAAWFKIPKEARDKYKTWPALEAAIHAGEYPLKKAAEPAAAVAAGSAASPSDSAAVGNT